MMTLPQTQRKANSGRRALKEGQTLERVLRSSRTTSARLTELMTQRGLNEARDGSAPSVGPIERFERGRRSTAFIESE
jgi:hypothetical protein